jgi:hypothetical protein
MHYFQKPHIQILELHDSYWFYQLAINKFKRLESYEILKFYLVKCSSSEISQDNLSVLKFEFRLEILGVCSEGFNLLFQITGVLIDNDILYFESPYSPKRSQKIIKWTLPQSKQKPENQAIEKCTNFGRWEADAIYYYSSALNIEQKPEKFSPFHCSVNSNIFSSIIINFIGNPIFIRHKTFLLYWPARETIRLVTGVGWRRKGSCWRK